MSLGKEEIEAFLREPNVAVIATVTPDGSPHAVPTWYEYDNGEIVLHMGAGSRRYGNIKRNSRVVVCIDTRTPPYKAAIIEGRARTEETKPGAEDERTRRMAVHYLGEAVGNRYADAMKGQSPIVAHVSPERILSWDYSRGDNP